MTAAITRTSARAAGTFVAWIALLLLARGAPAQSPAQIDFDIRPQELSRALIELGRQAGVQIAFVPDREVKRRRVTLRGRYTVEEALRRLLEGSGLTVRSGSTGTWIVERAASGGPDPPARGDQRPRAAEEPEITVTGSRIRRRDLEAASPLLLIGAEQFELTSHLGLEATLNRLPRFQPAETQYVATSIVANAFSSPGISTLDLRGLGSNRSLVLVDGRRAQPANATLTVDVNAIPAAALAGVEVITGGASSVYGADAIAGVVSFRLRRDFQGVSLDAQSGITEWGDGSETRVSLLIGSNLEDGRGNVMFGGEWARRGAVQQRDREFFTSAWEDPGTITGGELTQVSSYVPTASNLPDQTVVDAVFAGFSGVSRSSAFFVNPDGTLFKNTLVPGDPAASSIRYTGPMEGIKLTNQGLLVQPERSQNLSSPLDRYSLFGNARYEVTDGVGLFLQGTFSSNEVLTTSLVAPATTATFNVTVPRDGAHAVPPELQALLDSRPDPNASFQVDRYLDFLGPRRALNRSTAYQIQFGLEGELPFRDWTWEAYASRGETRILNYLTEGWASRERLRRVVAAPNYGENLTLSAAGSYGSTCTSGLPIFDYFTPSQNCIDAISVRMKNVTHIDQDIFEANLQGRLLDLPAGELRIATGASQRQNSVVFDPDTINDTESVLDMPVGLFAAANTAGETRVNEAYAELLVPLLSDRPFARQLHFELGARFSSYDTAGGRWTYKGLASWKVNDIVSFRGGYQFANRAPNVAELYLGVTQAVVSFPERDPCTSTTAAAYGNAPTNPDRAQVQALCSAIIGSGTSLFDLDPDNYVGPNGPNFPFEREGRSGNVNLKPEKADTITLGTVVSLATDDALPGDLNVSLDYYSVKIDDTIGPLAATTIYRGCFNADGVSNPTYSIDDPNGYCRLIARDPVTGQRLQVTAPLANRGTTETSGIDLQLDWRAELADLGFDVPGSIQAGLAANVLLSFTTQATPTAPREQNKGAFGPVGPGGTQTGQFDYRTYTSLGYANGPWTAGLNWWHLPAIRNASYVVDRTTSLEGAGAYDFFSLFATWQANHTVAVRAGIENLFDREPEVVGRDEGRTNAGGMTVPGFYDLLGRRYYLGVKMSF